MLHFIGDAPVNLLLMPGRRSVRPTPSAITDRWRNRSLPRRSLSTPVVEEGDLPELFPRKLADLPIQADKYLSYSFHGNYF